MDTLQLTKDLARNKQTKTYFRGVFPADKLPKNLKRPAMIIANTDRSTAPGKHWVAFSIPRVGKPECFDSFGRKPDQAEFLEFLKRYAPTCKYNTKRVQGLFSTTCGNYAALFLLFRAKKISTKKFLRLFSENFPENDIKVAKLYKKHFKKDQVGANIICNQTCQAFT